MGSRPAQIPCGGTILFFPFYSWGGKVLSDFREAALTQRPDYITVPLPTPLEERADARDFFVSRARALFCTLATAEQTWNLPLVHVVVLCSGEPAFYFILGVGMTRRAACAPLLVTCYDVDLAATTDPFSLALPQLTPFCIPKVSEILTYAPCPATSARFTSVHHSGKGDTFYICVSFFGSTTFSLPSDAPSFIIMPASGKGSGDVFITTEQFSSHCAVIYSLLLPVCALVPRGVTVCVGATVPPPMRFFLGSCLAHLFPNHRLAVMATQALVGQPPPIYSAERADYVSVPGTMARGGAN